MADQQRIHPVAVLPTRPPQGTFPSVKVDHPSGHNAPVVKRKNCWYKCFCWIITTFILLLIIVAAALAVLYLVFQPKLPKYSVDNLRITDLTLNFDLTLYARFDVSIIAKNPNKKIGIYYEKGSRLSVWYKETNLCQGSIPRFYQGHQNTTVLEVGLTGQNQYGTTLLQALQEQQQTGRIPLDLKIDVPVRIKLGKLKLMKVRTLGSCKLIVDSLSTNKFISIKASNCNFGLKL
ncbi:NDR1/HIN1-like protein 6 [Primulina huaijiensis]|uniref:NDR1/HIN1-like protein 6 n=1 Tax=Primulina huaijiensis TaxID=1492673 RepID=UPI003CC73F0A